MKQRILLGIIVGSAMTAAPLRSIPAEEPTQATTKTPWKISADLEEACSCNGPCPCWFKALPSRMSCDGSQVVFIKKGHYGNVSLDGLALAQFVKSTEGQSMAASFGNWHFDDVYIDDKANEAQRKALQEIAAHLFAPGAKKREFHYLPISRKIEGSEHTIAIGQSARISAHLIDGGYRGAPKIVNPPLADPTHKEFLQGVTTKLVYTDAGQNWDYERSNYMFNQFEVNNVEYEKFEAEMAKKMEAAKKTSEK